MHRAEAQRQEAWKKLVMPKVRKKDGTSRKKSYRRLMQGILASSKTDDEKRREVQIQIQNREGGGTFSKLQKI